MALLPNAIKIANNMMKKENIKKARNGLNDLDSMVSSLRSDATKANAEINKYLQQMQSATNSMKM